MPDLIEGRTGTDANGTRVIVRGGRVVPLTDDNPTMAASGFVAPPSGAPDRMARRQEYGVNAKELKDQRGHLASYAPLMSSLDRYESLNTDAPTGGLVNQIPGLRVGIANALGGGASEMAALSSEMQVKGVPQGQGAVSNFERTLYAQGKPDLNKAGGVNQNIINYMRGTYQQENDRLAFQDAYLSANGSLSGANEAWATYSQKNPYTVNSKVTPQQVKDYGYPETGKLVKNDQRTDWRDYFGLGPAPGGGGAQRPSREQINNSLKARSAAAKKPMVIGLDGRPIR